jgi:26S proteasome regulatory subunit N1
MLGRQNMFRVEFPEDDSEIANLMGNTKLSDHYRKLAAELDVLEPKAPEDIYKTHLLDTRHGTFTFHIVTIVNF